MEIVLEEIYRKIVGLGIALKLTEVRLIENI